MSLTNDLGYSGFQRALEGGLWKASGNGWIGKGWVDINPPKMSVGNARDTFFGFLVFLFQAQGAIFGPAPASAATFFGGSIRYSGLPAGLDPLVHLIATGLIGYWTTGRIFSFSADTHSEISHQWQVTFLSRVFGL